MSVLPFTPDFTSADPRTIANRLNAQKSTGPTTEAGKAAVSLNALKHGCFSHSVVLPTEDHSLYRALTQSLIDHYRPHTDHEHSLVQTLADTQWRRNRVQALDHNLLTLATLQELEEVREIYGRERNLDGSDSVLDSLAQAQAFQKNLKAFTQLQRQEARLDRLYVRTEKELRQLQDARLAAPTLKPSPTKPVESTPAPANGFVPSVSKSAPSPEPQAPTKTPRMPKWTGRKAARKRAAWLEQHGLTETTPQTR